jgi:hypothetical protein
MERVFYNSHLYSPVPLLQLCSFCFTANVLKNIMDNLQSSERFKWSEFNINDPDFKFQYHNAIVGLKRHNPWKK